MSDAARYAVIGRSHGEPTLYHLDLTRERAERLRAWREAAVERPCFVVTMAEWLVDPMAALRRAEGASDGG